MHLILTGATGLVGAGVLHNMLAMESVSRISILSRRPVAMAEGHDKAHVIIHKDFKNYDDTLLEQLKDAQGVVWALGVSQNDVNKTYASLLPSYFWLEY
jgi:malate/lactate dehydrogenase